MYKIKNENGGIVELLLYDLILSGYTASAMIGKLKEKKDLAGITLRINSDGGDVFEAIAVYNYLKSLKVPVNVYIDGLAASAASIVACAGHVVMSRGAMMMIHNPWGYAQGDSEEMRKLADTLDKVKDAAVAVYAAKTGQDEETLAMLMDKETWMNAEGALALGFCDEVSEPDLSASGREQEDDAGPEQPVSQTGGKTAEYLNSSEQIARAVKAERRRMRELDEINAPGREKIIQRAKYETFETAQAIALDLLMKAPPVSKGNVQVYAGNIAFKNEEGMQAMIDMINRKRGY